MSLLQCICISKHVEIRCNLCIYVIRIIKDTVDVTADVLAFQNNILCTLCKLSTDMPEPGEIIN